MLRNSCWISILVLLFVLLAACSQEDSVNKEASDPPSESEEDSSVEKPAPEESPEPGQPEPEPVSIYPLTGEQTNESVQHRVLSVMVNNHTRARPQSGLSQADMVYEVLAEGQITRFLALFHSDIPEVIGPVRSARPYYVKLASGFDAFYVYHGASAAINRQVANSGIPYFDGAAYDNNGWLFERSSQRSAPHNSYFLTEGLERAISQKGYEAETEIKPLPFSDGTIEGKMVNEVEITYSDQPLETVSFTYDQEAEQFLRSSDGEESIDATNSERLDVENVWIVRTGHEVVDSAGRRDIDLTSGGEGYLLRNGRLQEVQWRNVDGRILPFKDNQPLSFTPGQTWVNIIPEYADVSVSYSNQGGQ